MFAINFQILCFEWLSYEPLIGSNKLFCQVLLYFPVIQLVTFGKVALAIIYSSIAVKDFAYVFD